MQPHALQKPHPAVMSEAALTGRAVEHIAWIEALECELHVDVAAPFKAMRMAARGSGVDLRPVSAFRGFARQLAIWNEKFLGRRAVLDAAGTPVDVLQLSPEDRIEAILRWSALPGASRHHWGTDLDLIDGNVAAGGYSAQLVGAEYASDGAFALAGAWLETHAEDFGFFRPFRGVHSGVAPEPWHWSYAPIAEPARAQLTVAVLQRTLAAAPIEGKVTLLARLEELHHRYVRSIDRPRALSVAEKT